MEKNIWEITLEERRQAENLWASLKYNETKVLFKVGNLQITPHDLKSLSPRQHVNDTIIEAILVEMSTLERRTKIVSTFFFPNLMKGINQTQTKFRNLIENLRREKYEIVFIPVYHKKHWMLAWFEPEKSRLNFYDPKGHENWKFPCLILEALKTFKILGSATVKQRYDLPTQENNTDCGIYILAVAICILHKLPISFHQRDIPALRRFLTNLCAKKKDWSVSVKS